MRWWEEGRIEILAAEQNAEGSDISCADPSRGKHRARLEMGTGNLFRPPRLKCGGISPRDDTDKG